MQSNRTIGSEYLSYRKTLQNGIDENLKDILMVALWYKNAFTGIFMNVAIDCPLFFDFNLKYLKNK
jgi:hypothetical protein